MEGEGFIIGYTKFEMPIRYPRECQVDGQVCESGIQRTPHWRYTLETLADEGRWSMKLEGLIAKEGRGRLKAKRCGFQEPRKEVDQGAWLTPCA